MYDGAIFMKQSPAERLQGTVFVPPLCKGGGYWLAMMVRMDW